MASSGKRSNILPATNSSIPGGEYTRFLALPLGCQGYYRDFSYNIPVANGNYQLTLKLAEIQYSSAGSRIFNVTISSAAVLTNFDIVAQVGAWKANR